MQPRRPHPQTAPSTFTTMCPISPAKPRPRQRRPPWTNAPPTPVPQNTAMNDSRSRPAPRRASASVAAPTSLVTRTGAPTASPRTSASGKLPSQPGRFLALVTVPASASTWPGEPTPTPIRSPDWACAAVAASPSTSAIACATSAGPPRCGVLPRDWPSTSWCSSITTAWIFVPPRSMPPRSAMPLTYPHGAAADRGARRHPAKMRCAVAILVTAAALVACGAGGQEHGGADRADAAQARGARLEQIGRFQAPLYVASAPGDDRHLYVVEQGGRIMVLRGRRQQARPFLDIRPRVLSGGEQGLLSVAFAPDFRRSRLLYVYFTGRDAREYVVEYRAASAERVRPASARVVLAMDDPEPNHNGGLLLFGPDRHLYIGTGDGGGGDDQHGSRGNAQDLGSLLGKILRIDPVESGGRPYTVPADNPFVGRSGARPEIYSYGLR